MQNFKISKRLRTLVDQTTFIDFDVKSIADIGTDHGYLPFLMLKHNLTQKGILCDINNGPLDNAIETFKDSPYGSNIDFRLGSGIEPLHIGEVDMVFIAGMGGGLIKDILQKDLNKSMSFPFLILQPMTEQDVLRVWLKENGFNILWDHFIVDAQKHYEIIVVSTKNNVVIKDEVIPVTQQDTEFGICYLASQASQFLTFLDYKEKKYRTIYEKINSESLNGNTEKLKFCADKLSTIQHIRSKFS